MLAVVAVHVTVTGAVIAAVLTFTVDVDHTEFILRLFTARARA
jgi:hypothetical protein